MHTYILITHTPCPIRDGVVAARTCRVGKYICVIFTKEQADGWMVTTFGDTGSEKGEAMGHISLFITSASGMLGMLASRNLSWRLEIGIEIEINDTFIERHGVCAVLWLWVFFVRAVVVVVVRRCIMSACLLVSHDYTVLCLMYHVSPKRKQAHMWSCPFAIRASGYYANRRSVLSAYSRQR